ncbi:MAG: hypothetical protein H6757_01415 [Candidatus Omnitrophica bacterium]|nr:hypothetical protein [Candidatus Omnitrophota bacterium]
MKKTKYLFALIFFLLWGCAANMRQSAVYDMSYDQTYLNVINALDDMEPWHLAETDQLRGILTVENGAFFGPGRAIKVQVKRVDAFKTQVEILNSRINYTNRKFFRAIDRYIQERPETYPS